MKSIRMKDVLPKLKEKYPQVDDAVLKTIIEEGCARINIHSKGIRGVNIDAGSGLKFMVYIPWKKQSWKKFRKTPLKEG